ncbi:hypothetical protein FRB99_006820 [Tulasnella sp. 403]|nr:hypothetical protein FRB99_006820 [Tulasnella sp. 403]
MGLPIRVTLEKDGALITVHPPEPTKFLSSCDLYCGHATDAEASIQTVALKRLRISQSDKARPDPTLYDDGVLEREASIWEGLQHNRILEFMGRGRDRENNLYLASPWMENGSLWEYIHSHEEANRPQFLLEVAEGLRYLHDDVKVVHCDIKGDNILVTSTVHAVICDFGLAMYPDDKESTRTGRAGTRQWSSPERLGNEPPTRMSDVYAFGITIYEILSGEVPFKDYDTAAALINAVVLENVRPPTRPAFSPKGDSYAYLWETATRCWNQDQALRPKIAEVCRWLERKEVIAKPQRRPRSLSRPRKPSNPPDNPNKRRPTTLYT